MDPISNLNPVLDALRRQLAENIERLRKSGKLAPASRTSRAEQPAAQAMAVARLNHRGAHSRKNENPIRSTNAPLSPTNPKRINRVRPGYFA